MKASNSQKMGLLLISGAFFGTGCGIEGFFAELGDTEHVRPVTTVSGSVRFADATVELQRPNGDTITPISSTVEQNNYTLVLPAAEYSNVRLMATKGSVNLSAIVPVLKPLMVTSDVKVDEVSTAQALIIDAMTSAQMRNLGDLSPALVGGVMQSIAAQLSQSGAPGEFATMTRLMIEEGEKADESSQVFQIPVLDANYKTQTSAINSAWLGSKSFDYTGDGMVDTSSVSTSSSSATFDRKLEEVAQVFDFQECEHPTKIKLVIEVDFNDGRQDGNCNVINRFKWVEDKPGKQMFWIGGIHEESPVQDLEADALLGNSGGWVPNQVPMYDDGTHGDQVARDNVWTITFDLPRTARIGYKYTWGAKGDGWTGSEEWPGNQHILELIDENGDNIIYRRDHFGDEATNKDKVNLNYSGMGTVEWDTDADGDGIPDARERHDLDNDCKPDTLITPPGVGPATIDCSMLGGQ